MSKPLFFTGRQNISRSDVMFRLLQPEGELARFHVTLDLKEYNLSPDADLVIEAYHNFYLERFKIGNVGAGKHERTETLQNLEPGDRPLFRLKVIGTGAGEVGKLIAALDEVRPLMEEDFGSSESLLPIVPKDGSAMAGELWRLVFVAAGDFSPELWVNKDVPELLGALQSLDPRATGMIMPDVLRQILRKAACEATSWTEEGNAGRWLSLATALHEPFHDSDDADEEGRADEQESWIEAVVARFASQHRFVANYSELQDGRFA